MRIFLSGPMGSGKSTVARAMASAHGPCFDLDQLIEQREGKSISALFEARGEQAFRELERRVLRELVTRHDHGVFALGGGTVTDLALRRELLELGTVFTLGAGAAELARRVGHGEGRPLLAGKDVGSRIEHLLLARADAYAECHAQVDTSGRDVDATVREILAVAAEPPVVVPLGVRTYRIEVAKGCRARLPARVASTVRGTTVVVVTDGNVGPLWAEPAAAGLRTAGKQVLEVALLPGEEHKTLESVERVWEAALAAGVDRSSIVVAVGGGVVGDLAGFAAATLLRGVAVGHVPTTLLAMVDSAIGGKTGFDTRHGKNLIGAFHQPSFVLCDVEVLSSLPARERRVGLAETVKSAFIEGEWAVAMLERDAADLLAGEPAATTRAIRMSAAMKARIVTLDERESSVRALLNLGHTVGHAIEASLGYRGIKHGEAVALGMVAAFRVAVGLGHAAPEQLERMTRLLQACGLPTDVGPYLVDETLAFIASDKKRRGGRVTFVLPSEPGKLELRPLSLDELSGLLRA